MTTEGAASAAQPKGLGRKIAIAMIFGVLVFAALSLAGDVRTLAHNLSEFHWSFFVAALSLAAANYLLRAVRFQYYLRLIDVNVPFLESAVIFFSGFVMSVTPGKIGEVFKSALLYEARGAPIERTAPVVIAERLTDLLALVILTSYGAWSFPEGRPVAIIGGAVTLVGLLACAVRPIGEMFLRIAERAPVVKRLAPKLRAAYEALHVMTRARPLLIGTSIAVLAWGLEVVALQLTIVGFPGADAALPTTMFIYSASTIAGALAMMPGGLGVTEAGMTGLLTTLVPDMTTSVATAVTMLCRIATLWWAVAIGIVALAIYRRTYGKRGVPPPAP